MNDLTTIASEINEAHGLAIAKACEALEHARRAGELLLQAKGAIGHGGWLPWIEANCSFSARTAQRYMNLSEGWDRLQGKYDTVSHLTLNRALSLISKAVDAEYLHLNDASELSTNLPDGRLILISPSANHPGYFFVNCVNTRDWIAEGWERPVKAEYVPACLNALRVPPDWPWMRHEIVDAEPVCNESWVKEQPFARIAKCVNLEIMPEDATEVPMVLP